MSLIFRLAAIAIVSGFCSASSLHTTSLSLSLLPLRLPFLPTIPHARIIPRRYNMPLLSSRASFIIFFLLSFLNTQPSALIYVYDRGLYANCTRIARGRGRDVHFAASPRNFLNFPMASDRGLIVTARHEGHSRKHAADRSAAGSRKDARGDGSGEKVYTFYTGSSGKAARRGAKRRGRQRESIEEKARGVPFRSARLGSARF